MDINNRVLFQWGHYPINQTIGGHATTGIKTVTLPLSYSFIYNSFACCRNTTEFSIGVIQPNLNQIQFGATSHSNNAQHIYGIYWCAIGY